MSIGAIGAYSTSIQPLNYSVKNQSQVSDAFTESMEATGGVQLPSRVGVVSPVQYPNARITDSGSTVDMTTAVEKSKSANQKLNQVAAGYAGMTTGYGSDSSAKGYELIGSILDLYA